MKIRELCLVEHDISLFNLKAQVPMSSPWWVRWENGHDVAKINPNKLRMERIGRWCLGYTVCSVLDERANERTKRRRIKKSPPPLSLEKAQDMLWYGLALYAMGTRIIRALLQWRGLVLKVDLMVVLGIRWSQHMLGVFVCIRIWNIERCELWLNIWH